MFLQDFVEECKRLTKENVELLQKLKDANSIINRIIKQLTINGCPPIYNMCIEFDNCDAKNLEKCWRTYLLGDKNE